MTLRYHDIVLSCNFVSRVSLLQSRESNPGNEVEPSLEHPKQQQILCSLLTEFCLVPVTCTIFVMRFISLRNHRGWRDVDSLYSWAFQHLPSLVTQLNRQAFRDNVLDSEDAWIIDFYAPWCGHCIQFAPDFEKAAKVCKGTVWFPRGESDENFSNAKKPRALRSRLLSGEDCILANNQNACIDRIYYLICHTTVTEKKRCVTSQLTDTNEARYAEIA